MSAALVFRIVYTTFYFYLYIVLVVLLLVSPADIIYQSLQGVPQTFFVIVIAAAYFATTIIVVFVYSGRLYINRSVLASIPKAWIPTDKGDVPSAARKMIVTGLSRSAAIAFDARPRALAPQPGVHDAKQQQQQQQQNDGAGAVTEEQQSGSEDKKRRLKFLRLKKTQTVEIEMGIDLPPHKPVWGEIEHNGWGSPLSPDFPSLEYATVVSELPHLIEAKALTLAPPDPISTLSAPESPGGGRTPAAQAMVQPDPDAVALLQRGDLPLRDYLTGLVELGVLPPSQAAPEFLAAYEQARFSTRPLSGRRFRELMHLFADLLRSMTPLDPAILFADDDDDGEEDYIGPYTGNGGGGDGGGGDSDAGAGSPHDGRGRGPSNKDIDVDIDDEAPAGTASPSTFDGDRDSATATNARLVGMSASRSSSPAAQSTRTTASSAGYGSSTSSGSQIRHRRRRRPQVTNRTSSSSFAWQQQFMTAPNTPKSRRTVATTANRSALSSASSSPASAGKVLRGADSVSSFAQTRHPYPISQLSSGSLRSVASDGSVVRFRDR